MKNASLRRWLWTPQKAGNATFAGSRFRAGMRESARRGPFRLRDAASGQATLLRAKRPQKVQDLIARSSNSLRLFDPYFLCCLMFICGLHITKWIFEHAL